jgi:hypothetical protein
MPGIKTLFEDMVPKKKFAPTSLLKSSSHTITTTHATTTSIEAATRLAQEGHCPYITSSQNGDAADVVVASASNMIRSSAVSSTSLTHEIGQM